MNSFLELLAEELYRRWNGSLRKVCVVLPNRRAGLYLRHHLARLAQRPVWAPDIYSAEDFVFRLCPYTKAESFEELLMLYQATREVEGIRNRSFEDFLDWGQVVLSDFNEVDTCLTDASLLFRYLNEVKTLSLWGTEPEKRTEFQNQFLGFYKSLGILYHTWKKNMEASGLASTGLAFRWVSEHLGTIRIFDAWEHFVFAGFNATTPAEDRIINALTGTGKADVFYDADEYYLNDTRQEAGHFLRTILQKGPIHWIGNNICGRERSIVITGIPGQIGQVKALGSIIAEKCRLEGNQWLERAAVVLPDESLLEPVLRSIPGEAGHINVTMGFPLGATPAYSLLETFAETVLTAESGALRLDKLISLIRHPYIWPCLTAEETDLDSLLLKIGDSGMAIASEGWIATRLFPNSTSGRKIIQWCCSEGESVDRYRSFLFLVDTIRPFLPSKLHEEYLYLLSETVRGALDLVAVYVPGISFPVLHRLISGLSNVKRMPFYGEPLSGLQVMGMLETRTLDFETLFVLSANDDILPGHGRNPSFIPFDVRVEEQFSLPVYSQRNAVMAYHFYRLLQRCSTAFFYWNTEPGNLGGGEMSRFLLQVLHEFPRQQTLTSIKSVFAGTPFIIHPPKEIVIPQSDVILRKLTAMASSGFSPTALWSYSLCRLMFYFDYILGLRKYDRDKGSLNAARFGSVVHEALAGLYPAGKDILVTEQILDKAIAEIDSLLEKGFRKELPDIDLGRGHNRLLFNVSGQLLRQYILMEKEWIAEPGARLVIVGTEIPVECTLAGFRNPSVPPVKFAGRIDRVDEWNGKRRIVDFKTGRTDPRDLILDTDKPLRENPKAAKAFQLLMYKWMYMKSFGGPEPLAGILSFRGLSAGIMPAGLLNDSSLSEYMEGNLRDLMDELFDSTGAFYQASDPQVCRFCTYRFICHRD